MELTGHTVLITGGGSGIGLAIAKTFRALDNRVIVSGRDETKLRKAVQTIPGIETVTCDVTRPSDIASLASYIDGEVGGLTILVNNAGIAYYYDVSDGTMVDKARKEMETNYLGLVGVTEALLPILKLQSRSAIVNVSPVTAYTPSQWLPTYSASKAAVHSFSTSLRHSLDETPVKVFDLLPPLVDTDLASTLTSRRKLTPQSVATALMNGMKRDTYDIRVASVGALYPVQFFAPSIAQRIMNSIVGPVD